MKVHSFPLEMVVMIGMFTPMIESAEITANIFITQEDVSSFMGNISTPSPSNEMFLSRLNSLMSS